MVRNTKKVRQINCICKIEEKGTPRKIRVGRNCSCKLVSGPFGKKAQHKVINTKGVLLGFIKP